ncbi:MAG TPA: metal-dependent hydrolase [Candidatus Thermoplasmatota archaeon]|nr:metal-dependent hydrolase [Candidatus Thermoplasmatota archaeon]
MFSTAHLTSGVALGLALGLEGWPLACVVLASVFTDWDYAFQLLTGRNHREFVTHSPLVYLAVLGPLGLWQPLAWWVLLGSLLHFSLDIWEYGIRLNPFERRIYGFRLLPGVENAPFGEYLRRYFRDPRFFGAEAAFALAAAGLAAWRLL